MPDIYSAPVAQLLTLGEPYARPFDYTAMGFTATHVPELIRMAQSHNQVDDLAEGDAEFAGIHAWRALGKLKAVEAIAPLLGMLHCVDDEQDDWVGEDLPHAFAEIGPACIAPVGAYLADAAHGLWARVAAASSLAEIGKRNPEGRADAVTALTDQLRGREKNDPILNGSLIAELLDLKAVESAPVIGAAFEAGAVDITVAGDWEDVQIALGLATERATPRPNYARIALGDIAPDGSAFNNDDLGGFVIGKTSAQKAKDKARKKQSKKSRQKNRKKK